MSPRSLQPGYKGATFLHFNCHWLNLGSLAYSCYKDFFRATTDLWALVQALTSKTDQTQFTELKSRLDKDHSSFDKNSGKWLVISESCCPCGRKRNQLKGKLPTFKHFLAQILCLWFQNQFFTACSLDFGTFWDKQAEFSKVSKLKTLPSGCYFNFGRRTDYSSPA